MTYVKSEISHSINIILCRRQRTIWQEGYDSPTLLTPEDVIRYIKYIYLNPTRAGLVEDISEYPGVSSWEMFVSGNNIKKCKKVSRPQLFKLPAPALSINEQKKIVEALDAETKAEYEFNLEPFAWIDTFPQLEGININELKQQLLTEIATELNQLRKERFSQKKRFIGATDLRRQSMLQEHEPKKFSKKMICICADRALRIQYIELFKHLSELAHQAYQSWKIGDLSAKIPPGMFAPRVPELASALYPV